MFSTLLTSTKKIIQYGKLYTWGDPGDSNNTGAGTNASPVLTTTSPTAISATNYWKDISTGPKHTLAVRADGTLWGWGTAYKGSLGSSVANGVQSYQPVQIGSANTWSKVSAGKNHSIGLKTDGTVWGWGDNSKYQLGGELYTVYPYWTMISTCDNANQSIGIKDDGTVWVWGSNSNTRLGIGSVANYVSSPTQVFTNYTAYGYEEPPVFTYVTTAYGVFLAIDNAGKMYTWGYSNNYAQPSHNQPPAGIDEGPMLVTTEYNPQPTWKTASISDSSGAAVSTDGKLYVWGTPASRYNDPNPNSYSIVNPTSNPKLASADKSWTTQNARQSPFYAYYFNSSSPTPWNTVVSVFFTTSAARDAYITNVNTYRSEVNYNILVSGYNLSTGTSRATSFKVSGNYSTYTYMMVPGDPSNPSGQTLYAAQFFPDRNQGMADSSLAADVGTSTNALGSGVTSYGMETINNSYTVSFDKVACIPHTVLALSTNGRLYGVSNNNNLPYGASQTGSGHQLATGSYPTTNSGQTVSVAFYLNGTAVSSASGLADGTYGGSSLETQWDGFNHTFGPIAYSQVTITGGIVTTINIYNGSYSYSDFNFPFQTATFNLSIGGNTFTVRVRLVWTANNTNLPIGKITQIEAGLTFKDIVGGSRAVLIATSGNLYTYTGSGRLVCKNNPQLDSSSLAALMIPDSYMTTNYVYKASVSNYNGYLSWIDNDNRAKVYTEGSIVGASSYTSTNIFGNNAYDFSSLLGTLQDVKIGNGQFLHVTSDSTFANQRKKLYVAGNNYYGYLGNGINDSYSNSYNLTLLAGTALTDTATPTKFTGKWKDIAAGDDHTLTLKTDGTLWASGDNTYYQCGPTTSTLIQQIGTKTWKSVYAAGTFSGAIDTNNKAFTWGNQLTGGAVGYDATYDGYTNTRNVSTPQEFPLGLWSKLSLASNTTGARNAGLTTSGELYQWGNDVALAAYTSDTQFNDFVKLSAGGDVAYGIKSDGSLWAWGSNAYGQLGLGLDAKGFKFPIRVGSSTWTKVATNGYTTFAIKSDGTLWAWGYPSTGSWPVLGSTNITTPTLVSSDTTWTDIAVGGSTTDTWFLLALKTNALYVLGNNESGQLGTGNYNVRTVLTNVSISGTTVSKIAVGSNHSIIKCADNTVRLAGKNDYGQLGASTATATINTFTTVSTSGIIENVFAGGDNSAYTTGASKELFTVGRNDKYQLGRNATTEYTSWTQVASGYDFAIALKQDGTLWGWGDNNSKQLDPLPAGIYSLPTKIGTKTWTSISASYKTAMAIDVDGKLWVWGDRTSGNSGTGTNTGNISATEIPAGGSLYWYNVKLGTDHCLAVKSNGTLWSWGGNNQGQLGLGDNTRRDTPTQVGTATNWSNLNYRLAAGYYVSYAINNSNAMYGWGDNAKGTVGNGTTTTAKSPVQIGSGTSWNRVSTYANVSLMTMAAALSTSGYLYTWGSNIERKLGTGGTGASYVTSPSQIGSYTWIDVSVGQGHVLAIKNGDSSLYAWGSNTSLETGIGYSSSYTTPTLVPDTEGIGWNTIFAGYDSSYATTGGNVIKAWGDNSGYRLGLGQIVSAPTKTLPVYQGGESTLALSSTFSTASKTNVEHVAMNANFMVARMQDIAGSSLTLWGGQMEGLVNYTYTDHSPYKWEGYQIGPGTSGFVFDVSEVNPTVTANSVILTSNLFKDYNSSWHGDNNALGIIAPMAASALSPVTYNDGQYDATASASAKFKAYFYSNAYIKRKDLQYPNKVTDAFTTGLTFKDISSGTVVGGDSVSYAIDSQDDLYVWGTTSVTNLNNKVGTQKWFKLGKGGFQGLLKRRQ